MTPSETYWLVGASEGIGAALAQEMDAAGFRLVLSARSEDRLAQVAAGLSQEPRLVPLDVTDPASVSAAQEMAGEVDGIVYLAGAYWPMRAQEWNAEQVETMIDVNFTGGARVLGAVLPGMVTRDRGHVVIVGSLAGFSGLPGAIGYGASKAGLMHLGLDMQKDLRGTGVHVQIVNPGFVRTRLTDKNDFSMPFVMETDAAARRVLRAMRLSARVSSFPALFALWFKLRRALGL